MLITLIVVFIFIQIIATLMLSWSGFVALFGLTRKRPARGDSIHKNRFAVVVCARNEEAVLSHLMDSLAAQDYPADLWHVYLLADHCTDNTATLAASYPFVSVMEYNEGNSCGKGSVLAWGIDQVIAEKNDTFDAFLFFDADNIAKYDFMSRINEAMNKGETVIQGNRLAGEPYRTIVTKWYAIYWVLYSYLYSYAREKLNLSCFLTGTGFAVKKEVLYDGWHTSSITEDVEFSFQRCLNNDRASFCEEAICYDEQPSSLRVMLRQLARWCTGSYQIFYRYFKAWFSSFKKKPRIRLVDNMALLMTGPCSVAVFISTIVINIVYTATFKHARLLQIVFFILGLVLTYVTTYITVRKTTKYVGIPWKKIGTALLTFPLFLWLFTLCSLYSLLFPQRKWKRIEHVGLSSDQKIME